MATIPQPSDFPPGTEFVIKEFDVPLARVPCGERGVRCEWFNWFGGTPRPYPVDGLKLGNNWPAASFDEWVALVKDSMATAARRR